MKKQIRKAMICTIAMMVAAIVSLTGVTYAWFSQSDTSVVEGIELGIVAVDGGVYVSNAPNPSFWGYRVNLGINKKNFEPASTTPSTLTNGKLQFFSGHVDEVNPNLIYTEAIEDAVGVEKYYIKQDLYIMNDTMSPMNVQLDPTVTNVGTGKVAYGMRIAIVDHGAYTVSETGHTADSVKATDPAKVYIYEVDAQGHLVGEPGAVATCGVKAACGVPETNAEGKIYPSEDCFNKQTEEENIYAGQTSLFLERVNSYYAGNMFSFSVAAATSKQVDNTPDITDDDDFRTETVNSYHKISVYIWLEGQDVDCTNAISGQNMQIQIGFTKAS